MKAAWDAVRLAAEDVCRNAADALRISNLCILAALAFDAGLTKGLRRKSWCADRLRSSIDQIALSALPKLSASKKTWES
jgi:hypothetical protein